VAPRSGLQTRRYHFHGVASRIPSDQTAFANRRDHFLVEILSAWEPGDSGDDDGEHRRWGADLCERLTASARPGGYPNLLGPDEVDRLTAAYGAGTDGSSMLLSH
jgi:hypothetical protein